MILRHCYVVLGRVASPWHRDGALLARGIRVCGGRPSREAMRGGARQEGTVREGVQRDERLACEAWAGEWVSHRVDSVRLRNTC